MVIFIIAWNTQQYTEVVGLFFVLKVRRIRELTCWTAPIRFYIMTVFANRLITAFVVFPFVYANFISVETFTAHKLFAKEAIAMKGK